MAVARALVPADDYVAVGRDGEIITDSALRRGYEWPAADPRGRQVPERPLDDEMEALVREAGRTTRFDRDRFWRRHHHLPASERALAVLNHRAFQFNSRRAYVGPESPWPGRVAAAVREGRPVEVVLPAFCVISNPVKRLGPTVPTAAEDVALLHLAHLARLVGDACDGAAVIHVVSDSTFYSAAFGVTSVEALEYVRQLRGRVDALGVGAEVRIVDMSELLGGDLHAFQEAFDGWCRALHRDPYADGTSPAEYARWHASMMASINSRRLGLSYPDLRAAFGPAPDGTAGAATARAPGGWGAIPLQAEVALNDYRAVKLAAADLRWEDRFFPGSLRATIHTKHVPVLGLRIYPEYKFRSTLLPYHGIGVIGWSRKSRSYRLTVEPELFVAARDDVTRVVGADGTSAFYLAGADADDRAAGGARGAA